MFRPGIEVAQNPNFPTHSNMHVSRKIDIPYQEELCNRFTMTLFATYWRALNEGFQTGQLTCVCPQAHDWVIAICMKVNLVPTGWYMAHKSSSLDYCSHSPIYLEGSTDYDSILYASCGCLHLRSLEQKKWGAISLRRSLALTFFDLTTTLKIFIHYNLPLVPSLLCPL